MVQAAFNKKKALLTSQFDLYLSEKLLKNYIWRTVLRGTEDTLAHTSEIYGKLEMWPWRRMEISWTDHVRK